MNVKFKCLLFATIAAMGFVAHAVMPEGCQRVLYLQGDGMAYVELDFPLTHEQTVISEFVCLDLDEQQGVFGARESATAGKAGRLHFEAKSMSCNLATVGSYTEQRKS